MQAIDLQEIQRYIDEHANTPLYVHVETTNGAYATHQDPTFHSAGMFFRNAEITYERGLITGNGPYRIGLKLAHGWLYGEGLTDFEFAGDQLLIAGHDIEGRLAIAFELSPTPFAQGAEEVDA
ncbi:hypothetical protein RSA42_07805 [Exiguobacterium indicum]|uniref:DUF1806 family protein n=2 Tax=Exiguobacterium TaxID=33986 RepID=A0ABX8GAD5_EXIAC|nr:MULTISPECIES: YojF family protein [Exiguobacterium]AOS99039.1 hypothetical protein ESP131_01470 [Exiguobacterium sp. U13-1]KNH37233.1 hypothetical protein ACS74_02295 [Exiguobacterium acetylicum]KTR60608.1 hypothetical protein RSA42_07805 [Exiguobacterium indicum]MBF8154336.1 YojF family protein [Exiguobacterium sp. TBG-PICH-001]OAI84059.1 hypothetical protein AYO36_12895 [Exiguobacterium sp. KKBO11]